MFRGTVNFTEEVFLIDEKVKKQRKIGAILVVVFLVIIAVVITTLVLVNKKRVSVETLSLASDILLTTATYTKNNYILILYKKKSESNNKYHIGIMNDNGKNLKDIWSDELTTANPVLIPFKDDARILLGDYILKCENTLSSCGNANLIPLNFPEKIQQSTTLWTNIILSPDNKYVAFTNYDSVLGYTNIIGKLTSQSTSYSIENAQIISKNFYEIYNQSASKINIDHLYYGKLSQFVNGGSGISLSGPYGNGIQSSVYINLQKEGINSMVGNEYFDGQIILSPNEQYGVGLSTKYSTQTNLEIIGLFSMPYSSYVKSKLYNNAYKFTVGNAQNGRGSIGPSLFRVWEYKYMYYGDIKNLHDNNNWIFNDANGGGVSWHSSNTKCIFVEGQKNSNVKRIRMVKFKKYTMKANINEVSTPETISYGRDISTYNESQYNEMDNVEIKGKSGTINVTYKEGEAKVVYTNFSGDGKTTYNGEVSYIFNGDESNIYPCVYTCNVIAKGDVNGTCDFKLTFDQNNELDFANNKTYGYSINKVTNKEVKVENYKK